MMDDIETTLRKECNLCSACIKLYTNSNGDVSIIDNDRGAGRGTSCTLCLGLLSGLLSNKNGSESENVKTNNSSTISLRGQLMAKLREKIEPYATVTATTTTNTNANAGSTTTSTNENSISKDSPTIVLPNIIIVIAYCINCAIDELIIREEEKINEEMNSGGISTSNSASDDDDHHHHQQRKLQLLEERLQRLRKKYTAIKKKPIDVYNYIKELVRCEVRALIHEINNEYNEKMISIRRRERDKYQQDGSQINGNRSVGGGKERSDHDDEEAGYLKFHLVFTPPLLYPYLPFASKNSNGGGGGMRVGALSLPKLSTKRERKRFRGNDPVMKQGGDPRVNLNSFVKNKLLSIRNKLHNHNNDNDNDGNTNENSTVAGHAACSYQDTEHKSIVEDNIHCCLIERNSLVRHLETLESSSKNAATKKQLSKWMLEINSLSQQQKNNYQTEVNDIGIFVSCWRNHFYLKGKYTKSRRDVSQTPFFVNDDDNNQTENCDDTQPFERQQHKRMKRLGISSVEEEICPIICDLGCNGISTANNETQISDNESKKSSNLVYGMCKFHASGREDMDVRMILPLGADEIKDSKKEPVGSGRPFVCEVIDAHKMPTIEDLNNIVQKINQSSTVKDNGGELSVLQEITLSGKGQWVNEGERKHVQYGCNPNGVGISGLSYCHSSSFGNLQSETEDKIKFYGCLCWSKAKIPSQAFLEEKLVGGGTGKSMYPLQIEQSTPLRVLHRRSASSRIRHVLSMKVKRIDDHWFRLHLSTSAGTYVKEFCHGDCGRTKPSVSSILGCKIDIVELDCEGIAV